MPIETIPEEHKPDLRERYSSLSDEELAHLSQRKGDLVHSALVALEREVAARGTRVAETLAAQQAAIASDLQWEAHQAALQAQKHARERRRGVWYLAVGTPLVGYLALSDLRDSSSGLEPPMIVLLIALTICWVLVIRERLISRKEKEE